jgi:hypothetical protein
VAAKGTETAVRLRASGVAGRHGVQAAEAAVAIEHCHFLPRTSSEATDRADTVVIGLTLVAPGGTDLKATDRIRRALDDTVWEIDGEPGDYRKRGRSQVVIAALRRAVG